MDTVTLTVTPFDTADGRRAFVFEGAVPARARGRYVEVLGRECGGKGFRLFSATTTRAGGAWRVRYPPDVRRPWRYPAIASGTTFLARWKGRTSAWRRYRTEAPLAVREVPGHLARRVHVSPPPPGTVSLQGRLVLLQRRYAGRWETIGRSRLVARPDAQYGALNHEAMFDVTRGSTLRVVLPRASASPCYLATASDSFRVW